MLVMCSENVVWQEFFFEKFAEFGFLDKISPLWGALLFKAKF